jgi:hypothetical protein
LNRRGRLSQRPHRTPKEEELRRRADEQPAHAEKKTGEEEVSQRRHGEEEVLL